MNDIRSHAHPFVLFDSFIRFTARELDQVAGTDVVGFKQQTRSQRWAQHSVTELFHATALIPRDLQTSTTTVFVEWNRDGVCTFRQRDSARLSLHSVPAVVVHNQLAVNDDQRTVIRTSLEAIVAISWDDDVTTPAHEVSVSLVEVRDLINEGLVVAVPDVLCQTTMGDIRSHVHPDLVFNSRVRCVTEELHQIASTDIVGFKQKTLLFVRRTSSERARSTTFNYCVAIAVNQCPADLTIIKSFSKCDGIPISFR